MGIRKSSILPLVSLIFIFGFFGVVSAAITSITVDSPKSGDVWSGTQNIEWTSDGTGSDKVTIYWKIPSGGSAPIVTVLATDGSFPWDTSSVDDGNYLILIEDFATALVFDQSGQFTIDNTPPTVDADADKISNIQFTQNGVVSDNFGIASIEWTQVSGPGTIAFGTPDSAVTTISADVDGEYVIRLTATDEAGNSNFDEMILSWDNTPPAIESFTFDGEAADVFFNPDKPYPIEVFLEASEFVDWVTVRIQKQGDPNIRKDFHPNIDGLNTTVSWDGSLSNGALVDGAYEIVFNIKDVAGNQNDSLGGPALAPHIIFVDRVDPTITGFIAPIADAVYKDTTGVPFTFTPSDTGSGPLTCSYSTDGGATFHNLTSCTSGSPTDETASAGFVDGRNNVIIKVTDAAGNTAETSPVSIVFDDDDTLSVPSDFTTIQEAINKATPGDTIQVSAGTYNGQITIGKSLTLTGDVGDTNVAGPGENAPILDGGGVIAGGANPDAMINLAEGVSNIVIEGFKIRNYKNPGHPDSSTCGFAGGGLGSGIIAWNKDTSNIIIRDNHLHNFGWNGILVGSDDGSVQSGWVVQRNIIGESLYAGIELTNVINSQVLDNIVTARTDACVIDSGDSGVGIEIAVRTQSGSTVSAGNTILVEGNQITGSLFERAGINILSRAYLSTSDATLTGVTISNNVVNGGVSRGIFVTAESRNNGAADVTNLIINNNLLENNADNIVIHDFQKGGSTGPATHSSISISNNNIKDSTGNGIRILTSTSASDITVSFNNITNNVLGINNEGDGTLNATLNWWGDASGPTHSSNTGGTGDSVSDNVDFTPWAEDTSFTRFFAPVLTSIENQNVDEGDNLTITLSATDADGDSLTYSISGLTEASFVDNGDGTASFSWIPTDDNVNPIVTFTVSDGFIEVSETITITVSNVDPIVEAGNNQEADEGKEIAINSAFTDAGSADTHTIDVNWGDGSAHSDSLTAQHTYIDDGVYEVTVTVTDDDGGIGSDTLIVTVINVAPVVEAGENQDILVGDTITLDSLFTDVGSEDTHTATVNWGDGNTDNLGTVTSPIDTTHEYTDNDVYTVTVTVTDNDGDSGSNTLTVTVSDLVLELVDEWNLVSVPKTLSDKSLFGAETWSYDTQGNTWNPPSEINPGIGYWVKSIGEESVPINYEECGLPNQCLLSETITFYVGWNLIGHMSINAETQLVSEAVGYIFEDNQNINQALLLRYNGNVFEVDNLRTGDYSGFTEMVPGEGYWLYTSQEITFTN